MNTAHTAANAERIDAVEVLERLDWQAMRAGQAATVTIDTATLDFLPNGPHQVAAMANLGAELLQEVKAYRPGFLWKSSPAEIVGALIEEMVAPAAEAAPGHSVAAALYAAPAQPVAVPDDDLQTALTVFDMGLGFALCHRDFGDMRNAVKKLQSDFIAIRALVAAPAEQGDAKDAIDDGKAGVP